DRADHLRLRRQRGVAERIQARNLAVPFLTQLLVMGLITVAHRPTLQSPVERLERRACVSRQRHPTKLVAVQLGDVDVDEPNVWVLKPGPRAGREVAVAGADADDDV